MAYLCHYYAQRGVMPSAVYNASEGEKAFLMASMLYALEHEGPRCPLFGGENE